jgi:lysophospholipase L1-like esterase
LAAWIDPARAALANRARGGRSSRTFLTEGLWDQVAASLKPGDVVLMQFGHNDGGGLNDPRNRALIKGNGDETQEVTLADGTRETVHSYGWYLRRYIADAKAKGAIAVVLSPVPRNLWRDGKVNRAAGDYGKWAREAAEAGGALFVDLNELVAQRCEAEGQAKVAAEYFGETDHTHTTPAGATVTAEELATALRGLAGCPVGPWLLPQPAAAG